MLELGLLLLLGSLSLRPNRPLVPDLHLLLVLHQMGRLHLLLHPASYQQTLRRHHPLDTFRLCSCKAKANKNLLLFKYLKVYCLNPPREKTSTLVPIAEPREPRPLVNAAPEPTRVRVAGVGHRHQPAEGQGDKEKQS